MQMLSPRLSHSYAAYHFATIEYMIYASTSADFFFLYVEDAQVSSEQGIVNLFSQLIFHCHTAMDAVPGCSDADIFFFA